MKKKTNPDDDQGRGEGLVLIRLKIKQKIVSCFKVDIEE